MKKGFVFVETMVVIAFLGTILLSVYSAFTSVIDSAKTRLYYDDPVYLYRTYYILTFLAENGLSNYIDLTFANKENHIGQISCANKMIIVGEDGENNDNRAFCSTVFNELNVSNIFIMRYNVSEVVKCVDGHDLNTSREVAICNRNNALSNLSMQATNYLYSLDGYTGVYDENTDAEHYRIVVEYKIDTTLKDVEYYDYYCSPSDEAAGRCKSSNKTNLTTSKYYYSTLEIPYGKSNTANPSASITCTNPNDSVIGTDAEVLNSYLSSSAVGRDNVKTITLDVKSASSLPSGWDSMKDISDSKNGRVRATFNKTTGALTIYGMDKLLANCDASGMFRDLPNLTAINGLNKLNTKNVMSMSKMFYNDKKITSIDLSGFDTSRVEDMSSMFANAFLLNNINGLNRLNTSKVTTMRRMFNNALSLPQLTLPFDTSNVTDMGYMFANASSTGNGYGFAGGDATYSSALTRLDISSFNTSNVTNMERMFHSLYNLTSLNLSNFDTSNVTNMESMFSECASLTSLNLSNFNTRNVYSMKWMFHSNHNLRDLNISNFTTESLTNVSQMFSSDFNLRTLNISKMDFNPVLNVANNHTYIFRQVGRDAGTNTVVTVKDSAAQSWILGLSSSENNRPASWSTANVRY